MRPACQPRAQRQGAILALLVACAGLLIALAVLPARASAVMIPPDDLGYQITVVDDITTAWGHCRIIRPDNAVMVITVRGSGEKPRTGKLATQYYPALAKALVARGYYVQGHDISYPAASTEIILNGGLPRYIDSAIGRKKSIAAQIQGLLTRCPTRKVIVAAYSQGGIALRAAMRELRARNDIWREIDHVDLIADAAADATLDKGEPVGRTPRVAVPARRGTNGIWSAGVTASKVANSNWAKALRAIAGLKLEAAKNIPRTSLDGAYPKDLRPRIDRYCMAEDLICDTSTVIARSLSIANEDGCKLRLNVLAAAGGCNLSKGPIATYIKHAMRQHARYPWAAIAQDTAALFPTPTPPATVDYRAPVSFLYGKDPEVRPAEISLSDDRTSCGPIFSKLAWSQWGPDGGVATGVLTYLDQYCGRPQPGATGDPVQVSVSNLTYCGGIEDPMFRTITWTSPRYSDARTTDCPPYGFGRLGPE